MADETRDDGKVCANPPCTCSITEKGEKYCSVHCQSTANATQIDCDCGHGTCQGDF